MPYRAIVAVIAFATLHFVCRAQDAERQPLPPPGDAAAIDALVASWLEQPASSDRDQIASELAKRGAAVVPAMECLIDERCLATALALEVLCRVGEPARPALPKILAILGDRGFALAAGPSHHATARAHLLDAVRFAKWAAPDLVPLLARIAADPKETEWFRTSAAWKLGLMGETAAPQLIAWVNDRHGERRLREIGMSALGQIGVDATDVVRPIAEDDGDPSQDIARHVLAKMEEHAGRQKSADFWAAQIRRAPFDPKVRGWLMSMKGAWHLERPDPLTQEVKRQWRTRLLEKPDAEFAFQLALLVQDQMTGTAIDAAGSHSSMGREDPTENYCTLAAQLRQCADLAEKYTPTWQRSLRGLAKTALLRGDWDGMNAALVELGQKPVAAELRPWLAAPPKVWNDLADQWQPCDASLRNGDCAFEVKVEKSGRGVRGAHVLVRRHPGETRSISTGIDVCTLLHEEDPIADGAERGESTFGYAGKDREVTRYAVTDDSGVARFEQLPMIEILCEVMIPTASFEEPISSFELWRRAPDGSVALSGYHWKEGFQLASGATTHGPEYFVRPQWSMNLADGQALAPDFELAWDALPDTPDGPIRYEIELACGFPPGHQLDARADAVVRLATATTETRGHVWPLGAQGIGEIALVAGNVYLVQVVAKDARDEVIARFGRSWCYVPWSHREAPAPRPVDVRSFDGARDPAPIEAQLWHLGEFHDASGVVESLPERLDRFLREQPQAFEVEYVRVAREWSRWRDGNEADAAAARAALDELARTLPAGNVAGDTARELVKRIDAHADPGKQLDFGMTGK